MEKILNELKEEIKGLTSGENLNVEKIRELIDIYSRLSAYRITSVSQVDAVPYARPFDNLPTVPVFAQRVNAPRNEVSMLYDALKEIFLNKKNFLNIWGKSSTPSIDDVHTFMRMYEFMDNFENKYEETECIHMHFEEIKKKLFSLILTLIDGNINEQNRKMKDEIEKEDKELKDKLEKEKEDIHKTERELK